MLSMIYIVDIKTKNYRLTNPCTNPKIMPMHGKTNVKHAKNKIKLLFSIREKHRAILYNSHSEVINEVNKRCIKEVGI